VELKNAIETVEQAQAERGRIDDALPAWIESLNLAGGPFGRFRFHHAQVPPWLLYGSQQMLSLALACGYWDALDEARKGQWLDVLLSCQDPDSGVFLCPVAGPEYAREGERWDPIQYGRAITMKLARRLRELGVAPRHLLPRAEEVAPPLPLLQSRLEALPWSKNVYGSGSQAGHWAVTRIHELKPRGRSFARDPYVMQIVSFLESMQNHRTGFWGNSPSLEDGMNGLLKTLRTYELLDRPLPIVERIVDSVLAIQTPDGGFGDVCSPWNAMVILSRAMQQTIYRRQEVWEAVVALGRKVLGGFRRQPDGFYSSLDAGCLTCHAGIMLCDGPQPVGDVMGTAQTRGILDMIERLLSP